MKLLTFLSGVPGALASLGLMFAVMYEVFLKGGEINLARVLMYIAAQSFLAVLQVFGGRQKTEEQYGDLKTSLGDILRRAESGAIQELKTPDDLFRELNEIRKKTRSAIRVMSVRSESPLRFDRSTGQFETGSGNGPVYRGGDAMREWYEGLPAWAAETGHSFERIMASGTPQEPNPELEAYAHYVAKQMADAKVQDPQLLVPWDPSIPALNLCIFDDEEVVVTFANPAGLSEFPGMTGIHIVHKPTVRFLRTSYYDPMRRLSAGTG